MTSQNLLERFRQLDRSSSGFHYQLSNILYGGEFNRCARDLQGDDLVWLVDYLDEALNNLDPPSPAFRKCLRELMRVCSARTILPSSYTLSPSVLNIDDQPVASGGSGDIFQGTLNGSSVCVKRIRIYHGDGPEKAIKTLYQEAIVWKHLEHQNIVPFLGITPSPLQLISEWMPGGGLMGHIRAHPDADRLGLLSDVTEGLRILHSRNIVHGDLKGSNILVDATSRARITDFGLARLTQNLDSMRSNSSEQGFTARWTAPEILNEKGKQSKEADIFSFAMVMIEVFTGAIPFNDYPTAAATFAIMGGKRPSRPTHPALTEQLWALIQRCWHQDPHSRPDVLKVLKVLSGSDSFSLNLVESHRPSPYNADLDESEYVGPYPTSQVTIQGPPSYHRSGERKGGQPNGCISRGPSPLPMYPISPEPRNHPEYNRAHGHPSGSGKSLTNPQNALDRDAPRSEEEGAGELLKIELGSRLTALIEACCRIPTVTKGVADLQRRCTSLREILREQPIPAEPTSAREWAEVMKAAITATSAATERVRFWTTKNRWRRFFRLAGSAAKDTERAAKEINRIAGELLLFRQIHGSERQSIGRPLSDDPFPFADRPPDGGPPTPQHTIFNQSLYEGRETGGRRRVRSLMARRNNVSRSRRSIVSEGHTSPDEDGESRKRPGYDSPRSRSVASSLGACDFTRR